MRNTAATLNTGDVEVDQAALRPHPNELRVLGGGAPMKFHYASGSRPLDGYTIKRGIGVGGFGEVYFAVSDGGKEVALKRIQRNLDVEVRGVSQCLNLKHANLIALFDVKYDDQGEAWVVMEYIAGEGLRDLLDRHPNGLPSDEVCRVFEGIAQGVMYLHDHGIVHRDLKPGNIFVDDGVVKIGDYGLSKFISCSRRSGQTESVGTFHYMAPEIGKGVYGKEIDIYALGIILFELLTGRVPFEGESSQEIIMKHLTADPDLEAVDEPFRRVIRKALAKDPDRRYSNVREMLAALKAPGESVPPVRRSEPVYILDDQLTNAEIVIDGSEEMYFGPLREVPVAQAAPAPVGGAILATRVLPPPRPVTRPVRTNAPSEPVARGLHRAGSRVSDWWTNAGLSTPVKILLLIAALFVFILNAQWLIPLGLVLGAVYLVYFGIRSIIGVFQEDSDTAEINRAPVASQAAAPRSVRTRRTSMAWRTAARHQLGKKTLGEKLGELTGSMLMAAVVVGVVSLVMMMLGGATLDASVYTWLFYGWLVITATAAAWSVLIVSKFWESSQGDPVWRRFIMMILGLGIGLWGWGASKLLMVRFPSSDMFGAISVHDLPSSIVAGGVPQLPAFLLYFAGLFLVLRWWRQADPLRSTRLSLVATGISALWAFLLPFPWPWGLMLVVATSLAVQMAAPWMTREERSQVRGQLQET